MKKSITLLCAFVLALSFNSCGGSDDSPSGSSSSDKIVGNWKYTGAMYLGDFVDDTDECYSEFVNFSSNKTGKYTDKYCGEADVINQFTWEKTTDQLYNYILTDSDGADFEPKIIEFSDNNQTITMYDTEEGMLAGDDGEVYQKQ